MRINRLFSFFSLVSAVTDLEEQTGGNDRLLLRRLVQIVEMGKTNIIPSHIMEVFFDPGEIQVLEINDFIVDMKGDGKLFDCSGFISWLGGNK